jgi:hypothetical protein
MLRSTTKRLQSIMMLAATRRHPITLTPLTGTPHTLKSMERMRAVLTARNMEARRK